MNSAYNLFKCFFSNKKAEVKVSIRELITYVVLAIVAFFLIYIVWTKLKSFIP
ncbi:hypothetical protein HON01_01015 [Candidatus Woesearchaeota archaeon]|nr:hypothetical protein [Candidatus Woesearchaeota archaeon]